MSNSGRIAENLYAETSHTLSSTLSAQFSLSLSLSLSQAPPPLPLSLSRRVRVYIIVGGIACVDVSASGQFVEEERGISLLCCCVNGGLKEKERESQWTEK